MYAHSQNKSKGLQGAIAGEPRGLNRIARFGYGKNNRGKQKNNRGKQKKQQRKTEKQQRKTETIKENRKTIEENTTTNYSVNILLNYPAYQYQGASFAVLRYLLL